MKITWFTSDIPVIKCVISLSVTLDTFPTERPVDAIYNPSRITLIDGITAPLPKMQKRNLTLTFFSVTESL